MGPQIIHIFCLAEFRCFEGASMTCRIVDFKLFIVLYLVKILSVSRNLDWGFNITKLMRLDGLIYRRNWRFDCASK
jgi:hypothetical protein